MIKDIFKKILLFLTCEIIGLLIGFLTAMIFLTVTSEPMGGGNSTYGMAGFLILILGVFLGAFLGLSVFLILISQVKNKYLRILYAMSGLFLLSLLYLYYLNV